MYYAYSAITSLEKVPLHGMYEKNRGMGVV